MKLIYVAGKYRAKTAWEIDCNIHKARQFGVLVARQGAYPVIPHSNTAHFDGVAPDSFWLEGTLELLSRCDGAVFIDRWRESSGSVGEWFLAERLNMPVLDGEELLGLEQGEIEDKICAWLGSI